jgi:type I restriction enzyme S subunit
MIWGGTTVGAEFHVQLGKMLDAARNSGEPKLYIGNRAVQWGNIDLSAAAYVPLSRQDIQRFRLVPGDLLVCEGGEVGRAAIWEHEGIECYFQKALHRLRPRRKYSARVLLALLELRASAAGFADYVTQTSIAHLPRDKFVTLPIPAIPYEEQQRIAEALGDMDALLVSLERLIAKKRAVKQGMMQELMSGRVRLDGFVEPWRECSLRDLIDGLTAGTSVRSVEGTRYPAVLKTSAVRGGRFDVSEVKSILTRDFRRASCSPSADSLIISRMNTPALVGDVGYVEQAQPDLYLPDRLWLARSKPGTGASMRWLALLLSHGATAQAVRGLATGTSNSMKNIPKGRLLSLRVLTPPSDEQHAIAEVLGDVDDELEALEHRLKSTRAIKLGMMQELLTGRTRLSADVEVAA